MTALDLKAYTAKIRACEACDDLPLGPNPIFQISAETRVLIAGHAPGRVTHHKGRPFDDASGVRLRDWLGVDETTFYGNPRIGIFPMGLCYPGTGKGGDNPPRPLCAQTWHAGVMARLPQLALSVIIGRFAINWHCPELRKASVTDAVRAAPDDKMILPHPSPRNNLWLRKNPWFEADVLPSLRRRVAALLDGD